MGKVYQEVESTQLHCMKRMIFFLLLAAHAAAFSQPKLTYHSASTLKVLGRAFPHQTTYKRFPDSLEMHLRNPVWSLSKNSAGIAIYFETNSSQVAAKWKTGGEVNFQHVAGTLVKGVDLYGLDDNKWYYAGIGRPSNGTRHESSIIKGLDGAMRQYILYLPCYDNTDSVEIGIDEHAFNALNVVCHSHGCFIGYLSNHFSAFGTSYGYHGAAYGLVYLKAQAAFGRRHLFVEHGHCFL